jgi:hypothetical protein
MKIRGVETELRAANAEELVQARMKASGAFSAEVSVWFRSTTDLAVPERLKNLGPLWSVGDL